MKRLLIFIILSILLCLANFGFTKDLSIQKLFPDMTMEVYTNKHTYLSKFEVINNGVGDILFCHTNEVGNLINSNFVTGFMIRLNDITIQKLFKKINPTFVTQLNFGIYGFSSNIEKIINKNNSIKKVDKNINFQVVEKENEILLGVPIILGSF